MKLNIFKGRLAKWHNVTNFGTLNSFNLSKAHFHYADKLLVINNKKGIRAFTERIFEIERVDLKSINYIFCSDPFLLKMNRQFLQHDFYTDILTFDLSEKKEIIGEVYISIDRVKDNAKTAGTPFKAELLRVVFHGALHLCGYNDKKKNETELMRNREDHYLRLYEKLNS